LYPEDAAGHAVRDKHRFGAQVVVAAIDGGSHTTQRLEHLVHSKKG
jgi:hypothetical protein